MEHSSCTIQSALYKRLHYIREDLEMIADNDPLNASALRIAQQKADRRIAYLRQRYSIPADQVPPDDWLWLNDLTVRELERWSLHNRGKTTYARALATKRRHERLPRTLIELGFLRSRYVAYRDNKAVPAHVKAEVYHDDRGMFVLVDDFLGTYTDSAGTVHDATQEGYTVIIQQFFYCFEAVNAAIAKLDGITLPPIKRWQPPDNKNGAPAQQANRNKSLGVHVGNATANASTDDTIQRDFDSAPHGVAFGKQNTIDDKVSSMVTQNVQPMDDLRTAPRAIETFISLMAHTLRSIGSSVAQIPDRATTDAATWRKKVEEPMSRLMTEVQDLPDARAWEELDLAARYTGTPGSPSWWQRDARQGGRKTKAPVTLENMAVHHVTEYADYCRHDWHPAETTPYDGPPLEYEQGYTGITQEKEKAPEPPIIVEEPEIPQRPAWMSRPEATELCYEIWDQYAAINAAITPLEGCSGYYTSIEVGADDQWHHLKCYEDWRSPSEQTQYALALALDYAASLQASSPDPGGDVPPIILTETPDNDASPPDESYVSMAEIGEELRGLRPMEALQSAEVASVIATQPLPIIAGKVGMSLFVAEALLNQIVSAGYHGELRNLADGRAMLAVEASPGAWLDIESAAQWQQYLKSSTSPPGSIAAVLAVNGGAPQMEAMQ